MSDIIEFPEREYNIKFTMPDGDVFKIIKSPEDKISIRMSNGQFVASVRAVNMHQAQDHVKRIFPDGIIIDDTAYDT